MNPMQLPVDAVLQRHNSLLEAHLKFLAGLNDHAIELPGAREVLEVCTSQTETMIEAFQQCQSQFPRGQTASEPSMKTNDASASKSNGTAPPKSNGMGQTMNPSGFFMSDTNPTPVEDLLRDAADRATTMPTRSKRKLEDEEISGIPTGGHAFDGRLRKKKRATGSLNSKASGENLQSDTPTKKEQADDEHSVDDSFIRQFQERLAAKEERRRKKADRKRKRDSGGSDSRAAQSTEEHGGIKLERHRRKKAKTSGDASITTSGNTSSAPFTPTTQSPQSAAQQDRGLKRPSPAAEYIGSLLANAERKRPKRQKT